MRSGRWSDTIRSLSYKTSITNAKCPTGRTPGVVGGPSGCGPESGGLDFGSGVFRLRGLGG